MSGQQGSFWRFIAVGDESACWEWTGYLNNGGYARARSGGKMKMVHRLAFEELRGPIPEGMFIDHMCHNRACANPAHLQVVTRKENCENLVGAYRNSKSGVRGVHPYKGKWRAQVSHHGEVEYLGTFDTIAEAGAVALARRNELFTNNLHDADVAPAA